MRKLFWLAAVAVIAGAGAAQAQETPRKGGTIRMTAPYAASFGSLDPHTTPRAQDDIVNKAMQRTLYNWDSKEGKLVLELAKSVTPSEDGLTYTYKLRDDAYFHNGRKMTADDIIWSYTRIMDGSKGYPAARYVRIIKGAVDVEKGQAKEISGLKKIDDFTLEMTLTDRVDPGYSFFAGSTAILPKEEVEKGNFAANPVGLGPFKFKEHIPGSRVVAERFDKFYKPGKPYADKHEVLIMAEAAARDVAFRNKEIDTSILGPAQYVAYREDAQLKNGILEVAEMFTRAMTFNHSHKPFADKRVRQAINHAIDADLIIKRLVKDKAYRAVSWLPLSSPAFDKSVEALCLRPREGQEASGRGGLSQRLRVRADDQPERELGPADRRGDHPDAGQGRHQGEAQAGRGHGADRHRHEGRAPGLYLLEPDRPRFAHDHALLLLQDAAHRLQLHGLQQPGLRQALRGRRGEHRPGQAQRPAAPGQQPDLRRSADLVLQLQQGGAGLSAVDPRPAGQPDRDHAPVSRGHLGRRQVAGEVSVAKRSMLNNSCLQVFLSPLGGEAR